MRIKCFVMFGIGLCFSTLILSCGREYKRKDVKENSDVYKKDTVAVKTVILKRDSVVRTIEYTATLSPYEEVHLAPASPGRIEKINVEIGDNVSKGDILLTMDKTNLEQARINLLKLENDFRRFDTLNKSNSVSAQQYEQIKTAYENAKTSYQFLLDNTMLKAPFDGVISGKYYENGEIYSGAPIPTIGKAAISVVQINKLKALVGISSYYFPVIRKGMKAVVKSDIYGDQTFSGEVLKKYPTIDNTTKTFTVEIVIRNDGLKLRPGMFAKIEINIGKDIALMIPSSAVIKQTGTNNMYVFINRNNIGVKKAVKTGNVIDDKIEIIDGIEENEELIIVGQNKLEDGVAIKVVN